MEPFPPTSSLKIRLSYLQGSMRKTDILTVQGMQSSNWEVRIEAVLSSWLLLISSRVSIWLSWERGRREQSLFKYYSFSLLLWNFSRFKKINTPLLAIAFSTISRDFNGCVLFCFHLFHWEVGPQSSSCNHASDCSLINTFSFLFFFYYLYSFG